MTKPIAEASGAVRPGLRVTITLTEGCGVGVVWAPAVPARLTPTEIDRYRAIRARALEQARQRGVDIFVIEA
jgi:hypothetical protein